MFIKKEVIYCLLSFTGTFSSTVSLCMSSYGLSANIGQPWVWEHYTIVSCIIVSIIVHSIKDSLISSKVLQENEDDTIQDIEN